MTAYLIGNTLGRLVLSYAIIWLAIWLGLAKLSWRDAFRRTNHWTGLTATTTIFLLGLIAAQTANAADRLGRPMIIHRLPALGLEIWTEQDPEWETHLSERSGAATFVAETPALTYPPAQMSWTTLPQLRFDPGDLQSGAEGALHQLAANHQVQAPTQVPITRQQYGDLIGYETLFEARSENIPIEVRAFCGHRPGKQPVLMQVTTLKNKSAHLAEHIRRSWTNVRYLP
jgi:hypothetical protein